MHGFIFSELRKYADTKLGSGAWNRLLAESGLGNKLYLPIQEYPDSDAVALVGAAAAETGLSLNEILEDFGHFLAPALLGLYRTLVKPEWKTLDLLENTEHTIHSVVRARNPGAKPANLQAVRLSPDLVDLTYSSLRRLCPVAKGIIQGMAAHYGENIQVTETACMHDGAEACRMDVRLVEAGVEAKPKRTPAVARPAAAKAAAKKPAAGKSPASKPAAAKAAAKKPAAKPKPRARATAKA